MYTKHHTEGIVLKTFDTGEADRGYYVLTRDLGLVRAHARGVRETKSKMRYGLQELSHSDISLVRARSGWRITSVSPKNQYFVVCDRNTDSHGVIKRVVSLVQNLVSGEDVNRTLYDTVFSGLSYLYRHNLSLTDHARLETLLVLRILDTLGYLGRRSRFEYLLSGTHVSDLHLAEVSRIGNSAVYEINRSLKETQM